MFKTYIKTNKRDINKITSNSHLFAYFCFFDYYINPSTKLYSIVLQMLNDTHDMFKQNFPICRFICPVWVSRSLNNGELPFYSIFIYAAAFYLVWQLIDFLKTKFSFFKSLFSAMFNKTSNLIESYTIDLVFTTSQNIENDKTVLVVQKNVSF
jgi:hypothetical protein